MSGVGGLDRTGSEPIRFGRLGFGCASLGGLYHTVTDAEAQAALEAAWGGGIRYFDTAPHYGVGLSEERLGAFLRGRPRDEFIVSTKVGRVLEPNPHFHGESDIAEGFMAPATRVRRFDPTEAGVRRSLEESLERMGLDRIDILFLHDPDVYDLDWGLREGLPALAKLRDEGLVREIGIGVNSVAVAARAVREGDLDLVMLAGRYTLLEQTATEDLFPLCAQRGVRIVNAAVYNSGLLATAHPGTAAKYNYSDVPADVLATARALAVVCTRFGVELPAAAIQYPLRNPLIATVVVGTSNAAAVRENLARMAVTIPADLWRELAAQGLIDS
ncbi:MAG: aldo/keto reductase [Candidatus Lumbricidophila eiseniae]|uniref:Aldo/keto reductase n=1 Tax=Candidatus Lumbricidiphila eiseniae TaxID=1969409 RepID=A0A2A6FPW7_9MICO|nr:MAG: aldo/keto reductase [Candidatus Lumbricidophila eiseniae]